MASLQLDLAAGAVVRVFAHALGSITCFSYVTHGLARFGQAELVFTLQRAPDAGLDRIATEPLPLLRAIAGVAARGQLVGDAGITELGGNGLFGRPHLRGLAYQRAWPMAGVELADGCLAMIALVGPEMDVVKRYGATRVLARLGRASRFFPTAVWCDPDRAPHAAVDEPTLLANVASGRFAGVSVVETADRISLRLPRALEVPALPPPEAALALLTSLDAGADACLVWSPGQREAEAITLPGSRAERISGCFAVFVPQEDADAFGAFEDGFACRLTDRSWAVVRDALVRKLDAVIPSSAGKPLAIEWLGAPLS